MTSRLRFVVAVGLTLLAAGGIYIGIPFWPGLVVWFFLAIAIGFAAADWWALLFAAIPWPLGVGGGLITGRYAYLGDGVEVIVPMIIGGGLLGTTIAVVLSRFFGDSAPVATT